MYFENFSRKWRMRLLHSQLLHHAVKRETMQEDSKFHSNRKIYFACLRFNLWLSIPADKLQNGLQQVWV